MGRPAHPPHRRPSSDSRCCARFPCADRDAPCRRRSRLRASGRCRRELRRARSSAAQASRPYRRRHPVGRRESCAEEAIEDFDRVVFGRIGVVRPVVRQVLERRPLSSVDALRDAHLERLELRVRADDGCSHLIDAGRAERRSKRCTSGRLHRQGRTREDADRARVMSLPANVLTVIPETMET